MAPPIDYNATNSLVARARALAAHGVSPGLAELRNKVAESLRTPGAERDFGPLEAQLTVESLSGRMVSDK